MNALWRYLRGRGTLCEAAALSGLVLFFLLTTVPDIAKHPIVGGDEGWIISASAKLAEDGVFGSDLFAGFFGADERYYFNLPLYHLVLAAVFKVAGVGLAQARLTSTVFGLAVLGLTYLLGRRAGGRCVGLGSAALLVLLRLNLAPFTGLTLTDLGATARYDLIAVPFALAACLLLLPREASGRATEARIPTPRRATAAGLVLGLGCLTQFIAAFMVAPLALFLLTLSIAPKERILRLAAFGAAVLLPFLPYLAYVAPHWDEFNRQASSNEQVREPLSPSFYLDSLGNELDRYDLALDLDAQPSVSEITERPSGRLALLLAGPLALAAVLYQASKGRAAHRLVAFTLVALLVEFALLESSKRYVYWVLVTPFLCVALADAASWALSWRPRRGWTWRLLPAGIAALALVFAAEGLAVGARNVRDARNAPDYAAVGTAVRTLVPSGSTVVTDNRMWLTLRDMEARSLLLLFYWTNPDIAGAEVTDVEGAMRRIDAHYLLLSPLTKEILAKLTPSDTAAFQRYLAEHGRFAGAVSGLPYGPIEVYELR